MYKHFLNQCMTIYWDWNNSSVSSIHFSYVYVIKQNGLNSNTQNVVITNTNNTCYSNYKIISWEICLKDSSIEMEILIIPLFYINKWII